MDRYTVEYMKGPGMIYRIEIPAENRRDAVKQIERTGAVVLSARSNNPADSGGFKRG
jgi:hypothetical protein